MLIGNHAFRRAAAARERGALARKRRQQANLAATQRTEARAERVANRIARVKARKLERMIELENSGVGMTKKQRQKISPAEQRQINRRLKSKTLFDRALALVQ